MLYKIFNSFLLLSQNELKLQSIKPIYVRPCLLINLYKNRNLNMHSLVMAHNELYDHKFKTLSHIFLPLINFWHSSAKEQSIRL